MKSSIISILCKSCKKVVEANKILSGDIVAQCSHCGTDNSEERIK